MPNKIVIEQEFRASRAFDEREMAHIVAAALPLTDIGEAIADDGRVTCEGRMKHDDVECALEFRKYADNKVGYVCARNLKKQLPCADKRMPTVCMQKLLESLDPQVDGSEELPTELI